MQSRVFRILLGLVGLVVAGISFLVLAPSFFGALIVVLLGLAMFDLASRRRQSSIVTFNASLRAVCNQDRAVESLANAFSRSGPMRDACREYAKRLKAGEECVQAAIAAGLPLQLSTAVAMSSGRRLDAGREQTVSDLTWIDADSPPVYGQFLYLIATALVTCMVMAYIGVFVAPTFEQLFAEFGLDLPQRWIFNFLPSFGIVFLLGLIAFIGVVLMNRLRWLGMRLPPWIPVTPSMAQRRSDMLTGLADGIEAGWPMGRTLALGHAVAWSAWERRNLETAMRWVERGVDPVDAMQRAGWLSSVEAGWLRGASPQRAASLLKGFANQSLRDAKENSRWIMTILFPVVVLALGTAVLLYAYAFFSAFSMLTYGLT